jgi:hypothetical protein
LACLDRPRMAIPSEIQRIAGDVPEMVVDEILRRAEVRARALEILAQRRSATRSWQLCLLIAAGAGWGWFITQHSAPWLVGIAAGVGLMGSAVAIRENVDLRKRVDAIVDLLAEQGGDGA